MFAAFDRKSLQNKTSLHARIGAVPRSGARHPPSQRSRESEASFGFPMSAPSADVAYRRMAGLYALPRTG